ncbi:hypothetical protein ABZ914_30400 [Spirillospora sp. NPDC046719]
MTDEKQLRVVGNRFADAVGPGGGPIRDRCMCFDQYGRKHPHEVAFHAEQQDETAQGWLHLLELVDEAAADGREVFKPLAELSPSERLQIVTLPASIARLTRVKHLILYGSNMVRLPPEIGAMTSLEEFDPYTSHRLHWFPYELTRCSRLRDSTVSTRSIYGNFKTRPPFPRLRASAEVGDLDLGDLDPGVWGARAVRACSVCDRPITGEIHQRWISLQVATDVLPLLVNACSPACAGSLPPGARNHVHSAHTGGPDVEQPPSGRGKRPAPGPRPDAGS